MEKGIFGTICGVIGAAIGSVATYFLTKNKIENDVREECEGRFRKAQNDLNKYYKTHFEPKKEPVKDSILMQNAYKKKEKEATIEDKLRETNDVPRVDYDQFYTPKELDEGDEYYMDYGEFDPKYPHIITKEQFEESNGFVKLKLTYYEESGVFAHTGNLANSGFVPEYFGSQNLSEFGNYKYDDGESDPYMLWFRSENDGTDFQIYYEPYATYEDDLAKENGLIDE